MRLLSGPIPVVEGDGLVTLSELFMLPAQNLLNISRLATLTSSMEAGYESN